MTFMFNRRGLIAAAFGALLALTGPAAAADQTQTQAGQLISSLGEQALAALTGKDLTQAERENRFRALLRSNFDVPAMGRFVLGRYWRTATPVEQTDYLKLFEDLIVQAYAKRFAEYSGEQFKVLGIRQDREDYATVQSQILRPTGEAVRVDWRVRSAQGQTRIIDVMVEGISMAQTQRDEFASVIQSRGGTVTGLNEALRQKTAQQ